MSELDTKRQVIADKLREKFKITDALTVKDMIHLFSESLIVSVDTTTDKTFSKQLNMQGDHAFMIPVTSANNPPGTLKVHGQVTVKYRLYEAPVDWKQGSNPSNFSAVTNEQQAAYLDDHSFTGTVLKLTGWHCSNESASQPYHCIIVYDVTKGYELARYYVVNFYHDGVKEAYPNRYNNGWSGFTVDIPITSQDFYNDELKVISRYTGNGSDNDYWFDAFTYPGVSTGDVAQSGTFTCWRQVGGKSAPDPNAPNQFTFENGHVQAYQGKTRANGWLWAWYNAYSGARHYFQLQKLDGSETWCADSNGYNWPGNTITGALYDVNVYSSDLSLAITCRGVTKTVAYPNAVNDGIQEISLDYDLNSTAASSEAYKVAVTSTFPYTLKLDFSNLHFELLSHDESTKLNDDTSNVTDCYTHLADAFRAYYNTTDALTLDNMISLLDEKE